MQSPGHDLERLEAMIVADLATRGSLVVALSGGVDSGVVAALAYEAVGPKALAVTAAAETLAGRELDAARHLAAEIGIEHRVVTHSELDEPEFVANPRHRCFVCQGLRMGLMTGIARREGYDLVCDGTNASDPGPNRPGLRAVREAGVYSPLLAHGVDKATTRSLAQRRSLSVWDRPSNACLSSRIPHGQIVTLGKLKTIEVAEEMLFSFGFGIVRVRHDDGVARVEVGPEEVERLVSLWPEVEKRLAKLGFDRAVYAVDGYRTGGADLPLVVDAPVA